MAGNVPNSNIPTLGPEDILFIYFTGHGGHEYNNITSNDESFVFLSPPTDHLYSSELNQLLENINCSQIIVMMNCCESGQFKDGLLEYSANTRCKNRVIHTATDMLNYAHTEMKMTNGHAEEFTWYWNAAARGYYPVP